MANDIINYVTCQTSLAHTFGNMCAYIQDWLESQFEPGHFKTRHIHSKIAHRQIRNTNTEFSKKPKPMMIIRPRIEWDDDDAFLAGSLVTKKVNDLYMSYGGSNLQEFIHDPERRLTLKYQLNRNVFYFDVILIYGTLMQQVDMASYIQNRIPINTPFNIETCLEGFMPKNLISSISQCSGVPMYDEFGSAKKFLDYLNGHTLYPVTYKLKSSSQTDEFFRYYPVKIDTLVGNFSVDDGEQVNRVNSKYQVSFTIRCEFNTAGTYFLFSEKFNKNFKLDLEDSNDYILPMYTDVYAYEDINIKDGWVLYTAPSCKLEDRNDTVDIHALLNPSIRRILEYHLKNGIPVSELLEIKIRQQGKALDKNKFVIDYEKDKIYFIDCPVGYTYKIILYLNLRYTNNLIQELYNLK